jgi:hypothetical protein
MQKYKKIIIKFFKQLSIVDYLLSLLVLLALVFVVFHFDREKKPIYIDMLVKEKDFGTLVPMEKWQILQMAVGDKIYNFAGDEVAELVFLDRVSLGGNQKFDVYLTLKIEALYDKRKRSYSYLGKPLVAGKYFDFTTAKYFFEGEIVDVYKNPEERMDKYVEKQALVKIKMSGIENLVADKYCDLFLNNYTNQDILKINGCYMEPNKSQAIDYLGRKVVAYEQLSSDIYFDLTVRVWCFKDNLEICFYSYRRPLMVNEGFYNDTDRFFLVGKVLDYTLLD